MKIVNVDQMRELESACVEAGVSLDTLMENAGFAVADAVRRRISPARGKRVLVLIGRGNNGGDGLVAARHLAHWGADVTAYLCLGRPEDDPKLERARAAGVTVGSADSNDGCERVRVLAMQADAVIDGVLGTGRGRPIDSPLREQFRAVREACDASPGRPVIFALDLPSGLNADTGEMDENGLPADVTLMLGRPKIGAFLNPDGTPWEVLDIGIPKGLDRHLDRELLSDDLCARMLPPRPARSHKGTFGRALVVAGSRNYVGAAYLSSTAAVRAGAGLVTLATPGSVWPLVAGRLAEATYIPLPEDSRGHVRPDAALREISEVEAASTALLIGPGLGQSGQTRRMALGLAMDRPEGPPMALDADCLNILAGVQGWAARLRGPSILTPHPGEMARLAGLSTRDVEADRAGVASRFAAEWGHIVILKGACTVIAHPDGRMRVSPWVNPGMATGGTGDVLAGLLAGFLAQRMDPLDAAALGVYVHGMAGAMARELRGEAAMTPSDILEQAPGSLMAVASR
ncbi:MAG: NAD(P)H-hydrate dehydratase [Chloroflexota bacterium]